MDRNKDAIDALALEIVGNVVTGEAHAAPRTSVTVSPDAPTGRIHWVHILKLCCITRRIHTQDWEELRATFEWTDKNFGRIDSVVCCAGVTEMPSRFDADAFDGEPDQYFDPQC